MRVQLTEPKRAADETDFSDLTDSVQTGPAYWQDGELDVLVIPFDPEPSPAEALAIRRRLVTAGPDDEALLYDLLAADSDSHLSPGQRALLRSQLAAYGEASRKEPPRG